MKELFLSTFSLIFLAELPDKTAFAIVLMASRGRPLAVFVGAAAAFFVQSIVAVLFGRLFSVLPENLVRQGSGVLFFIFAVVMWRKRKHTEIEESDPAQQGTSRNFIRSSLGTFLVIFVAEWGDLTQLATATLEAKYKQPMTIFLAATSALWFATALSVFVGNRAGKLINQKILQTIGAFVFLGVGIYLFVSS